jgi:hypothetical protein
MRKSDIDSERILRNIESINYDELRALWDASALAWKASLDFKDIETPEAHRTLMYAAHLDGAREKLCHVLELLTGEYVSYGENGEVWVRNGSLKSSPRRVR